MLVATPNLCIDRTQVVTDLVPGAVLRAQEVHVTAGGKGVNVARVLRAHRVLATVVGLVAAGGGEQLRTLLREEGADLVPVEVPGDVRVNTVLVESTAGRMTVINEPGSPLSQEDWRGYCAAVARSLPGNRALACSGSLPPGAPPDAYAQLVDVAHHLGIPALVDCAPGALAACLPAGPDLVSPNLQEAEAAITGDTGHLLVDAHTDVRARASAAATALLDLGASAAAVTAGAHGVALAERGGGAPRWWASAGVAVVSTVGAGDAFLGGVLVDVEAQPAGRVSWPRAVLLGSATASASCEQLLAGGVDPQRARELYEHLQKRCAAREGDDDPR